jgi:hypothetical protein
MANGKEPRTTGEHLVALYMVILQELKKILTLLKIIT